MSPRLVSVWSTGGHAEFTSTFSIVNVRETNDLSGSRPQATHLIGVAFFILYGHDQTPHWNILPDSARFCFFTLHENQSPKNDFPSAQNCSGHIGVSIFRFT